MNIIPGPASVIEKRGFFNLNNVSFIFCDIAMYKKQSYGQYLADRIFSLTGLRFNVSDSDSEGFKNCEFGIYLIKSGEPGMHKEEYNIKIESEKIVINACEPQGLFYGAQSLCSLIFESKEKDFLIPCLEIKDRPFFPYRGLLLDCSRHFLSKDYLMRSIDTISKLKMNILHLHLTDDQGWRLEIKKYPELTEKGAYVNNLNKGSDGYYSQEDMREIVSYAKSRHITVIPEIEIPGHSFSAMLSLPWLCCTGNPKRTDTGFQKDIYCGGSEKVYSFLYDVLDEVMDVFPSNYIHIGGDEAPKDCWEKCAVCQEAIKKHRISGEKELQGYMINQLRKHVESRGRRLICWDEVVESNADKNVIIQWWRYRTHGEQELMRALRKGHQVIASPNIFTYLSFPVNPDKYFSPERTSDLKKVFSGMYLPSGMDEELKKQVIGAVCCVWTEYLDEGDIESKLFPRILACAEKMWSGPQTDGFDEFYERVKKEQKKWEREGIVFGPFFSDRQR